MTTNKNTCKALLINVDRDVHGYLVFKVRTGGIDGSGEVRFLRDWDGPVSRITCSAQTDTRHASDPTEHQGVHSLYGYKLEVEGRLSLQELVESTACMRAIDRKLTKIADRFGHPPHFASFVLHLADALGAEVYTFDRKVGHSAEYERHAPENLVSWFECVIRTWKKAQGIEVA